MKILFSTKRYDLPISNNLKELLTKTLLETETSLEVEDDIIFNFRDPDYNTELGGYHPVEIRLIKANDLWSFDYITDFCFVGSGFCAELTKEIDFDFGNDIGFHLYTGSHSLVELKELYEIFESNFISYVEMDCFAVSISCS